ncbi:MAG: hypothetical protein ACYDHF_05400 [Candidatus Cryosericum sp.]|jgi:hypothetical protein
MRRRTRNALALFLVAAIGIAAGCAPKAAENEDIPDSEFIAAARSFAEQAAAAGNHHLTGTPVVTIDSKSVQAGRTEVILLVKAMDVLNSGDVDAEPGIAGKLQFLQVEGATLSAAARKAVEDDIASWRGTIKSAMTKPSETNYIIKIVADVDTTGKTDKNTLHVHVDNGAVKSNYIPAAQFLDGIRALRVTVAQAYDSAASIAAAAKAP